MWSVDVLLGQKDGFRYVGMTQNLEHRLSEHNSGKCKFTSDHIPWKIIYSELFANALSARDREKYFKNGCRKKIS
ncbi:MAG: GIY-YIG nuclease family protein [Bacteroidetes bacterium]|nr:GIY-YIG nuclease family protein [Bacteroidota bacterium]MBI3482972.1 GIY-YIG nuclease family protein [Bacteroidota bacterium]